MLVDPVGKWKNFIWAKFDVTKNEVEGVDLVGFPQLYFFPKAGSPKDEHYEEEMNGVQAVTHRIEFAEDHIIDWLKKTFEFENEK